MNFFMEVAKLRAARLLWAKLVNRFEPQNPKSLSLRTHSQTSGWSLTAQDVYNNVDPHLRGGDGRDPGPHPVAAHQRARRGARAAHRLLRPDRPQHPAAAAAGVRHHRVIDPWGGSYYVERLTYDLARRAWAHIQEVEEAGGMAEAIDAGLPKLRVEEAAARTQARIDSGRQPVIGVNKYVADVRRGHRRAEGGQRRGARRAAGQAAAAARRARRPEVDAALDALTAAAG